MSTHLPEQLVSPPEHIAVWHVPPTHATPAWHDLPQAPQFPLSVIVLVHAPLQTVSPIGQVTVHAPAVGRPPPQLISTALTLAALSPAIRSSAWSVKKRAS